MEKENNKCLDEKQMEEVNGGTRVPTPTGSTTILTGCRPDPKVSNTVAEIED